MQYFLIKWLAGFLFFFCFYLDVKADRVGDPVALVALIVKPSEYDGHKVYTGGILAWKRDEQAIYVTREQAENISVSNSALLLLTEADANSLLKKYGVTIDECNKSWIEIRGVFSTGKDSYPGALKEIVEIYPQGLILKRQNTKRQKVYIN